MANKIKPKAPVAKEEPEDLTVDALLVQATQGEENAKASYFKQLGIKEFLSAMKKEGYELVKTNE